MTEPVTKVEFGSQARKEAFKAIVEELVAAPAPPSRSTIPRASMRISRCSSLGIVPHSTRDSPSPARSLRPLAHATASAICASDGSTSANHPDSTRHAGSRAE